MTAITRTRWHQYQHDGAGPFPGCTAICAMQDSTSGSDGLITWGVNGALDTYRSVLQESKDWEQARAVAAKWPQRDRDIGTAVHAAVDQFNRGRPLELTDDTAAHVAQYAAWLRNNNIEVVGSERYVINKEIGVGGTYDLLFRWKGKLYLGDVKTGKQKASQRLQLAGLSMAELHGDPGQEPEPMPKVEAGYIILLRPDGPPELIRHDITDEDRAHFIHLVETYHRVRSWAKAFTPTPVEIKEEAA